MGLALHTAATSFDIGLQEDICIECTRNISVSSKSEYVGKLLGKRIFKGTSVRGERICICQECLAKMMQEVKK